MTGYQFIGRFMQERTTLCKTKQGRTQTHTRPYAQVREAMRKPGIPPAIIPEITRRKQKRYNDSPVTLKQTTATPRLNESGEKLKVRRTVKQELS